MNAQESLELARRFIGLSLEKRSRFWQGMRDEGLDIGQWPIPAGVAPDQRAALSFAQRRMWVLWKMDADSGAYNLSSVVRLRGRLDLPALKSTFDALLQRHPALRTTFFQDDDEVFQSIRDDAHIALVEKDLSALNSNSRDARVGEYLDQAAHAPFDLEQGPLLRAHLLNLGGDEHVLLLTMHHIVSDGWSLGVLIREFAELYPRLCRGESVQLAPLPIAYTDYALWQRSVLEAGEAERQLGYWRGQLGERRQPLELPTDRPRPAIQSYRGASLSWRLPAELASNVRALAKAENVSVFMLLLAAFNLLLQRHSGQSDLCIGVPVANRNRLECEGLIGFFVNTQVLRSQLDSREAFSALLARVKTMALEAQAHQDLPFEQLLDALGLERSLSYNPLFQVMFNHQQRDLRAFDDLAGLRVEPMVLDSKTAKFDLGLDTIEDDQGDLSATFSYATDLFDDVRIAQLREHFERLLTSIVGDPQCALGDLPMLGEAEQAQLASWNQLQPVVSREPVHTWLSRVSAEQASREAVRCGSHSLTFAELEQRANQLAHYLRSEGVGTEVRVGVALPRSPQMIVALLAVLKAGGAYVPLDASYPRERLAYLMQDSGIALLLTDSSLLDILPVPDHVHAVSLNELDLRDSPHRSPDVVVHEHNLAYVIYTSGSTGQPKGVAVAHGPLRMHIEAIGQRYEMTSDDCELHFMSFAFDGAHERWLTALTHGARLLLRDDALWTPEQTYAAMHEHGVTVAAFPPVYLQQLAEHAERDGQPPAVRIYCFGGDAVPEASYQRAQRALRPQFIINGYGPTETVVTPLIWKADQQTPTGAPYAPIGSRIGERSAWMLDADLNPVPVGVAGELYLGGEGLARGYLNRAGLTAERFVADPFSTDGGRLYRTGDLVRQRADGTVDYLGRLDHQVKIRGFRIELGEIEARLQAQPEVRDAVVVARDGVSGKRLVAYIVASSVASQADDGLCERLKASLQESLPDYMVPAQWLLLEKLPVTPNGKLDRQNLPEPGAQESLRPYVAPRTELERALADIWQAVLKVEQVGLHDNFFELGGDSILSLQVVGKAKVLKAKGFSLKLRDLIQKPTIAELTGANNVASSATAPSPMLALNRAVPDVAPLFCVHAGFGTVFDYEPLARRLEGQRQVLAIQSRKLLDPNWQDSSLVAMAEDYVELMRARQPRGPYYLLGWSLGSTLATLMAARLEQQGQNVAFLGLADPFVPAPWVRETAMADWREDLNGFIKVLLPECPPLPAAQGDETLANLTAVLHAALIATGASGEGRYTALGAEEMAQVFCVARQLKQLSRQLDSCPRLAAAPICWWVDDREDDRELLATQVGHAELDGQLLACGHFEVPHASLFLSTLEDALALAPETLP
jgi:amino acid adenylation domain-containing protein